MIVDFESFVLDPIYDALGVEMTFASPRNSARMSITAIDKTSGVELSQNVLDTATVSPAVAVRASDLSAAYISPAEMVGVKITINGVEWRIERSSPKPGPSGANAGEVYFFLTEICG